MPELNGIEATRQIRAELPGTRVLAVSMHSDRQYVAGMLAAGAAGYVIKDGAFNELAEAIRTVSRGGRYLSPEVVGVVVDDYVQRLAPASGSALEKLSEREREVLQLMAEAVTSASAPTTLSATLIVTEKSKSAPRMVTAEMALVIDISGVCKSGGTREMSRYPTPNESTNTRSINARSAMTIPPVSDHTRSLTRTGCAGLSPIASSAGPKWIVPSMVTSEARTISSSKSGLPGTFL